MHLAPGFLFYTLLQLQFHGPVQRSYYWAHFPVQFLVSLLVRSLASVPRLAISNVPETGFSPAAMISMEENQEVVVPQLETSASRQSLEFRWDEIEGARYQERNETGYIRMDMIH